MAYGHSTRLRTSATPVFIVDSRKPPTSFRKSKNWRNDMILLRHDCLVFKTSDGDSIPCSAEQVTLEIIGDAIAQLDEQTVKQASAAVLHYFKAELGKTSVTVGEVSTALEHALRSLGLKVQSASATTPPTPRVVRSDLSHLAKESDQGFEL